MCLVGMEGTLTPCLALHLGASPSTPRSQEASQGPHGHVINHWLLQCSCIRIPGDKVGPQEQGWVPKEQILVLAPIPCFFFLPFPQASSKPRAWDHVSPVVSLVLSSRPAQNLPSLVTRKHRIRAPLPHRILLHPHRPIPLPRDGRSGAALARTTKVYWGSRGGQK